LNAVLIPTGSDLISYLASELGSDCADLSDSLVVFPGRRPGHFLRKALAEKRSGSFVPPRILSIDELIDRLYDARRPEPEPSIESIDAVAILYDIHRSLPRPLGGTAFLTPDSFFPLGTKIYNDLEELRIAGVESRAVGDVQALIEEQIPERSRDSLQTLQLFYNEFYPRVKARGFSTRSSRYWEVCTEIRHEDFAAYRRIILAGFFALTRAERALFASVGSLPGSLLVFQEGAGMREKLSELGTRVRPADQRRPAQAGQPRVSLFQSPDGHGQVFALNALLSTPDERTVIVLPSADTLFPVQRHCLSRLDRERYNISLGYPLVRTPVYGFLNDLMELVGSMEGERVYVPRYLTFMLHPYTKNTLFRGSASVTRVLMHSLEERLGGPRARLFVSLSDIESDETLFPQAALGIASDGITATAEELRAHLGSIHGATIVPLRSFASVKDFAERCIQCLTWVHDQTTARDHPFFSPFAQSFIETLETIARSLMRETSFQDPRSYFTLFRRYLESRYQRFPGTPLRGLQVLGSLETRNLSFDRVFVLDAVEGIFPQGASEDSLLTLSVRRALGLSTAADQEAMEKYYFSLLANGAKELTVFFTDSGERQKSRFVEQLLWQQQARDRTVESRPYVRAIQYRINLENRPPEGIPKTDELLAQLGARSFSASALDAYLRCPLAFYYSRVLGLSRRDEVTGQYEKTEIGTLVHSILAEFFRPAVGRRLEPSDLDPERMRAIVGSQFAASYGTAEAGAGRLLHGQILAHMQQFLTSYMAAVLKETPVTITAVEKPASRAWQGFTLTGRLDAIQKRGESVCVIDYKTGHDARSNAINFKKLDPERRETWSTAIGSLQLPVYLLLHEALDPNDPASAMFLLLGRARLDRSIELPLFADQEEASRELPRLLTVLGGLLREIMSADVPFFPTEDRKRRCPTCDFNGICGTRWLAQ
jgi:ATP-dependent helicase/nuclease subunit B